jgi:hypothetical protein
MHTTLATNLAEKDWRDVLPRFIRWKLNKKLSLCSYALLVK